MHIADGVLSTPVMLGSNGVAALSIAAGLRGIDHERVPRVGLLAAVFFMASFVHVRLGPSSMHLLLNGLLGLFLGPAALPALAVALLLQTVLLGYGGLSALGANVLVMGIPAVVAGALLAPRCRAAPNSGRAAMWGAIAGGLCVVLSVTIMVLLLQWSRADAFRIAVRALALAHVPLLLIEAAVAGAAAGFIHKVRPDLFYGYSAKGTHPE